VVTLINYLLSSLVGGELQEEIMVEPWKTVLCDSAQCISEMFVSENMKASDNSLTKEAVEKYKIHPDVDTEVVTQFTCLRCGKVQTWGVTRKQVAKTLYERFQK